MRGGVAGFHGCGLKGDGYGLEGEFFLLLFFIDFMWSHTMFYDVPNYDVTRLINYWDMVKLLVHG